MHGVIALEKMTSSRNEAPGENAKRFLRSTDQSLYHENLHLATILSSYVKCIIAYLRPTIHIH